MTEAPPLLVIAGATATGKTGLAIRMALALQSEGTSAEVISADSRQVFRGLDIGTAKPSVAERQGVRHHGLDLAEPDESFSVADFVADAAGVLRGIGETGGIAILAGGTGFYLRAIARGLDTASLPADPMIRARIEAELLEAGVESAAERLRSLAPKRAASVDLRNPRRVARALEIVTLQGDAPLPEVRGYAGPVAWIGLATDPGTHQDWIRQRAEAQFENGLVDEARQLRQRFDPSLPAFSAMGYREAWALIDGQLTRAEAIAEDVRRTVAFAKRQRTWFRKESRITWFDAGDRDIDRAVLAAAHGLLAARDRAR